MITARSLLKSCAYYFDHCGILFGVLFCSQRFWTPSAIRPWEPPLTPWWASRLVWKKSSWPTSIQARVWWGMIPDLWSASWVACLGMCSMCELVIRCYPPFFFSFQTQGMYIKSTYDGLHVITGTTEHVSRTGRFYPVSVLKFIRLLPVLLNKLL